MVPSPHYCICDPALGWSLLERIQDMWSSTLTHYKRLYKTSRSKCFQSEHISPLWSKACWPMLEFLLLFGFAQWMLLKNMLSCEHKSCISLPRNIYKAEEMENNSAGIFWLLGMFPYQQTWHLSKREWWYSKPYEVDGSLKIKLQNHTTRSIMYGKSSLTNNC